MDCIPWLAMGDLSCLVGFLAMEIWSRRGVSSSLSEPVYSLTRAAEEWRLATRHLSEETTGLVVIDIFPAYMASYHRNIG